MLEGRAWRIVDLATTKARLTAHRGQVAVQRPGFPDTAIPLADVAVVLLGTNIEVGPGVLHLLAQHGVATLAADWRGVATGALMPWSTHSRVATRHRAQVTVSRPRLKNAWQQIIRAKVRGQAATLELVNPAHAEHLRSLAADVRSGDPTNIEATAARYYWSRLFGEGFRRGVEGPTNQLLNYGYGVLRGHGTRATLAAGLSPPIGVFHISRSNYFNLVEDLIEPFRPVVDAAVVALGADAHLVHPEVKRALVAAATSTKVMPRGRGAAAELVALAQRYGRYIEGQEQRLTVPHWTNPSPEEDDRDDLGDGSVEHRHV